MSQDEAKRVLLSHPDVVGVMLVKPAGVSGSEFVTVQLNDGQMLQVNPALVNRVRPDETDSEMVQRVHGAVNAMRASLNDPAVPDLDQVVPLVRTVDYFFKEGKQTAVAVGWITDFIGFGLAIDNPTTLHVIAASDFSSGLDSDSAVRFQQSAVTNLRESVGSMSFTEIGLGSDVLMMTNPDGNSVAWFADRQSMGSLLSHLGSQTGTQWVAIPARRDELYLVNTVFDRWDSFLDIIESATSSHNGVVPLPYAPRDGGWDVLLPPGPSTLRRRLQELKLQVEGRCYEIGKKHLVETGEEFIATYSGIEKDQELMSWSAAVDALPRSSVPKTDLLVFQVGQESIGVRFQDAEQRLPHLFSDHVGTFPPRLFVQQPGADDYAQLRTMNLL